MAKSHLNECVFRHLGCVAFNNWLGVIRQCREGTERTMKYAWPTIMHNAVFSVGLDHLEITMGNLKSKRHVTNLQCWLISHCCFKWHEGDHRRVPLERLAEISHLQLTQLFGVLYFDSLFRHRARGNQCHVAQVAHSTHARANSRSY